MASPFADWYDRTATVTSGTTDEWGAVTPGIPVDVPCRIAEQITLVRNAEGEEVVSSTTLWAGIEWAAAFEQDATVTYTSPAGSRTAQVISTAVNVGDPDLEGVTVRLT